MSTKTQSSAVTSLQAKLAAIQAEIAALTQEDFAVTEAAVRRFTMEHFHALRMSLVVKDAANKPQLAKGRKGYALKKGVETKWYYAVKGLENTLKARAERKAKGEEVEVELSAKLNDDGRSQIMFAQEILGELVEAGFIDPNSKLLQGEPQTASKKRSRK